MEEEDSKMSDTSPTEGSLREGGSFLQLFVKGTYVLLTVGCRGNVKRKLAVNLGRREGSTGEGMSRSTTKDSRNFLTDIPAAR